MVDLKKENYIKEFQKYFDKEIVKVKRLNNKGNNELFEVSVKNREGFLLKKYSDRIAYSQIREDNWSRGVREFKTINFLWKKGFREIPKPINFYEEENIGIYSFERGRLLKQEEIEKKHIDRAVDFLLKLSRLSNEDKKLFPPAISACLCMQDYLSVIQQRFEKINKSISEEIIGEKAREFLNEKILPKIKELEENFLQKNKGKDLNKELLISEQVLTPGDFGFHNILIDEYGDYKFLDFEYFGREDPIKDILNLKHHAQMAEVNDELKEYLVTSYLEKIDCSNEFKNRLKATDSLIGMTWVLIYLNVLSKDYLEKIKEVHGDLGNLISERLIKAEKKFKEIDI